ncbi:IclR family transcriptional regulator [Bisgaardia hudsonensis]|uniref:IclR family transcriptional regulator n=1 Tax=Bisgaardia hudsonensis TaxID=109472 RepID=A0A4R2MWD9_9PAST|nr:IclR family transcriptional regulator [Bisgaardia hudsonensis]QLB13752.1 transcriptional regulator [Bisgaardia hudsonensis]TCP11063.1 IclR family transcriptional regulator [Bisgaardia hudsonensis]
MTEKSVGNQSLIRGLRLLDLLSNFPNGCPLAKLSELANLNKSTVHRLLQGLQSEGYIQPTSTIGSYRLTTKCLSLGQKTLVSMNIIHLAAPHLERLNLALGETVNLSKRENDHAIMIYKLEPTMGMMKTRSYIGQQLPLYCSAMGKIYLAYEQDQNYLAEYWNSHQDIIQSLTNNTITNIDKMTAELEDIRREQFAMDREENELGVVCIAYPIFDFYGKVNYSVSVSMSVYKIRQMGINTFLKEIYQTALDITKELGGIKKE